jgi:hypothetical protein
MMMALCAQISGLLAIALTTRATIASVRLLSE